MSDLIRDTDLADEFGISLDRLHRLRREKHLPSVKFSRTEFRFTEEQRRQWIDALSVNKATPKGQTARSAARSRS